MLYKVASQGQDHSYIVLIREAFSEQMLVRWMDQRIKKVLSCKKNSSFNLHFSSDSLLLDRRPRSKINRRRYDSSEAATSQFAVS